VRTTEELPASRDFRSAEDFILDGHREGGEKQRTRSEPPASEVCTTYGDKPRIVSRARKVPPKRERKKSNKRASVKQFAYGQSDHWLGKGDADGRAEETGKGLLKKRARAAVIGLKEVGRQSAGRGRREVPSTPRRGTPRKSTPGLSKSYRRHPAVGGSSEGGPPADSGSPIKTSSELGKCVCLSGGEVPVRRLRAES